MTTAELSQDLKEWIDGQLCLIYECGQNRDDVHDNINSKTAGMDDATCQAFYDYRNARELWWMSR